VHRLAKPREAMDRLLLINRRLVNRRCHVCVPSDRSRVG
jgi:hypothetical protein